MITMSSRLSTLISIVQLPSVQHQKAILLELISTAHRSGASSSAPMHTARNLSSSATSATVKNFSPSSSGQNHAAITRQSLSGEIQQGKNPARPCWIFDRGSDRRE